MASLRITLLDVEGNALDDHVDIVLKHTRLADTRVIKNQSGKRRVLIPNLNPDEGGNYQVQVFPMRHHAVGQIVKLIGDKPVDATFVCPVDGRRVVGIDAPGYADLGADLQAVLSASKEVEGATDAAGNPLSGPQLWDSLDAPRKAGLLNIYFKMKSTVFGSGRDVFWFVTEFTRVRGDRFFANIKRELRDETKNSQAAGLFHEVPGDLHTAGEDFQLAGSYKTRDHFGNLQLTFFSNPATLQFLVDADIDDAQGIAHFFQVLDHLVTGGDTNPFDIHEILLAAQKIDPHYTLLV